MKALTRLLAVLALKLNATMLNLKFATIIFVANMVCAATAHGAAILETLAQLVPGVNSPDLIEFDIGTDSAFATLDSKFGASTYSATASSTASFTELGVFASVTVENYAPNSFFTEISPNFYAGGEPAIALARSTDTVTISGGTGVGYLSLEYFIDGITDILGSIPLSWSIFDEELKAIAFGSLYTLVPGSISGSASGVVEFIFDTPFTFGFDLWAQTGVFPTDIGGSVYDYTGTADFSSTATLTTFAVFSDPDLLNPVLGFNASAESGTDYVGFVNGVPEPATIFLFGLGLAGLGWSRCKTS